MIGPLGLTTGQVYFVAVVKKGDQFTFYMHDYSTLTPLYHVTYPIPSTCLLVHDEVYQGSRIAFDETRPLSGCEQYYLDTVSYFNTALDAEEVNLLKTPNWISCGLESSRGTWEFDVVNAPWSPYPGTPAASLNMQWDNPCVTYALQTSLVDLLDFVAVSTCPQSCA
eukprot:TRINITY_DN5729_c0_g3_i1.p1 TRINITY_DN5729_c0_g3~~TRINITY_DN5729_c0_g3_i1.p1  ORF type:complete len:167 (-),score=13.41 TRINITY_DN5729_c0_g3_i1:415-915(-)